MKELVRLICVTIYLIAIIKFDLPWYQVTLIAFPAYIIGFLSYAKDPR